MTHDELRELFENFTISAFRYEGLPEYETSDQDKEVVKSWKEGGKPPEYISHTPWQEKVRRLTSAGKKMQRVRVLRLPLTDYLSMSVEWWYPLNIAAGEETFGIDGEKSIDWPE